MSQTCEVLTSYTRSRAAAVLFLSSFFASSQSFAQAGAGAPSTLMNMVPIAVMFAIVYILMIRPQMKRQKDHASFVANLKRGEEVLTTGGILGRIEGLTELYVTLEIAPSVRIRVLRSQIASPVPAANAGAEVKA